LNLPLLQLVRPAWDVDPSWTLVPDLATAAGTLSAGSHVFLATGRGSLEAFAARPDVEFTTRVIDETDAAFPLVQGRFLVSKPPFSVEDEVETLRDLGVSALVARNSGGTGGIEKVIAAGRLGIDVVMVARPQLPKAPRAASVQKALEMLEAWGWLGA
jgi:precorrin-6A/cobalt-precorrin-6A reductase